MTDFLDVLRLEVEDAPTGLVNMVENPNGELGGWGWATPVAGSALNRFISGLGDPTLQYVGSSASGNAEFFYTEPMLVSATQWVAARWANRGGSSGDYYRVRFEWLNSSQVLLSSSTQTAYLPMTGGTANYGPYQAPASTAYVRLRFDLYDNNTGTNPGAGNVFTFSGVTVAKAATSAALGSTRTNLVPNPTLSPASTPGWAATNPTSAIARDTALAYSGVSSLLYTHGASAGSTGFQSMTGKRGWPVTGGATYTIQFQSRAVTTATTLNVNAVWFNASGVEISRSATTGSTTTGAWTQYTRTLNAPATAAFMALDVGFSTDPGSGKQFRFDAFMVEQASSVGSYFDGTFADAGGVDYSALTWPSSTISTRTNFIKNPSFAVDAARWNGPNTDVSRTSGISVFGPGALQFSLNAAGAGVGQTYTRANYIDDPSNLYVPVTAGQTYTFSAYVRSTHARTATAQMEYWGYVPGYGTIRQDYVGTTVATTTGSWTRVSVTATVPSGYTGAGMGVRVDGVVAGEIHYIDAALFEQSSTVGNYFDGSISDWSGGNFNTFDNAWTGTAHDSASTESDVLNLPYSTALSSNLIYIEPVPFLDILGPTHQIKVTSTALDVGTLTATVISSTLDPSTNDLIRPGRRVRLSSLVGGVWTPLFTGKATTARVTYDFLQTDEEKRARIELVGVGAVSTLAQASRPEGVATIAELPYVLESAGVPWNCNGSGNQVPSATIVSINENAKAIDQCAITRDSTLGYVWVDRYGVLQAWSNNLISTTVRATLDDAVYNADIDIDYSTERCINAVTVTALMQAYGQTSEETYGPYEDAASIATWGRRSATFTVHGKSEGDIAAYAAAILAANSTPTVRINSVTVPIRAADTSLATIDLYDLVEVSNSVAEIDAQMRVTSVEHAITATEKNPEGGKWLMRLGFDAQDSVAAPIVTPPLPSAGQVQDTGWNDVTFANGWTHFDTRKAQYRRIGNRVQFRGIIKGGTVGSGNKAFSVPMDCAPVNRFYADHHWPVVTNPYVFGVLQAKAADGSFEVVSGSNTWLDISNVTYLID